MEGIDMKRYDTVSQIKLPRKQLGTGDARCISSSRIV